MGASYESHTFQIISVCSLVEASVKTRHKIAVGRVKCWDAKYAHLQIVLAVQCMLQKC